MQMEDNSYEELAIKVGEVMAMIKKYADPLEKEFDDRVRSLFIEAIGAHIDALHHSVNAMSLLILQCKDAGFKQSMQSLVGFKNRVNVVYSPSDDNAAQIAAKNEGTQACVKNLEIQIARFGMKPVAVDEDTGRIVLNVDLEAYAAKGVRPLEGHPGRWIKDGVPGLNFGSAEAALNWDDEAEALRAQEELKAHITGKGIDASPMAFSKMGRPVLSTAQVAAVDETAGLPNALTDAQVVEQQLVNGALHSGGVLEGQTDSPGYKIHSLKIWPHFFESVLDGTKNFEIRKNDRNFKRGDRLDLCEYIPTSKTFTGRTIMRQISYVYAIGHTVFGESTVALGLIEPLPDDDGYR